MTISPDHTTRATLRNTPSVMFVCVHNAGRSQMAAGYLTALSAAPSRSARPAPNPPTRSIRSRWP